MLVFLLCAENMVCCFVVVFSVFLTLGYRCCSRRFGDRCSDWVIAALLSDWVIADEVSDWAIAVAVSDVVIAAMVVASRQRDA